MRWRGRVCLLLGHGLVFGCSTTDTLIGKWYPMAADEAPPPAPARPTARTDASVPLDASMDAAVDAAFAEPLDAGPPALYIEAESGQLSQGFAIQQSDASVVQRYVLVEQSAEPSSSPGSERATYEFSVSASSRYIIWGRIHSPDHIQNRVWVRVDEGDWFLWRISTGDAWHWDDMHENKNYGRAEVFELRGGSHRLQLANAAAGMELDRFYITSLGDVPPGNTTPCNPPHSIELDDQCVPSCGSHGETECGKDECEGRSLIEGIYDCEVCCLLQ